MQLQCNVLDFYFIVRWQGHSKEITCGIERHILFSRYIVTLKDTDRFNHIDSVLSSSEFFWNRMRVIGTCDGVSDD